MSLSLSPGPPDYDIHRVGPELQVADWAKRKKAYYYYLIRHDSIIVELHIVGANVPIRVETLAPGGTIPGGPFEVWESRAEGDELVFYGPSGYTIDNGGPCCVMFDQRLMTLDAMPPEILDKLALNRTSVDFGG